MFKQANIAVSALLLLVLVALSACGGAGAPADKQGSAPDVNAGQGQQPASQGAAPADAKPGKADAVRTVAHAMGTTEIKGTPLKIVTLYQAATDAALQLGVKPVGAVESWVEQPWYVYIREQMDGVKNLGSENQPNLEEIAALKPDLIIGSKTRHEKIYKQLSTIAPTVMDEEVYIWKEALKLTAAALNKQEEEKRFLTEWDKKVADFKAMMGDRLQKTEVAVVDFRADHVRIVHTGFAALVLDELGIPRPSNQKSESWGIKLTSKENIPQMNADIIFDQTSLGRDDGRIDMRKSWMSHPLWNNLRAVQNKKVFEVDPVIWNNGSGPIAAMKMADDVIRYLK